MRSCVGVHEAFSSRPAGQGARHRWHCWTPFSPLVKVPSGQGLHSLTVLGEQCADTKVPAGHLSQTSWVPESGSVCWYLRGDRIDCSAGLGVVRTLAETTTVHKSTADTTAAMLLSVTTRSVETRARALEPIVLLRPGSSLSSGYHWRTEAVLHRAVHGCGRRGFG